MDPTTDNEWYTPREYIERVVAVMGGIDLDPASTAVANEVVGAQRYYTVEHDGLSRPWTGRVFMHPPGTQSLVQPFADKLVEHVRCGDVTQAIALVPNTTDARWFQTLLAAAAGVCFPACRIKFWHPNKPSAIPFQGHAFLYFGPCRPAFAATFRSLGCICYAPQ